MQNFRLTYPQQNIWLVEKVNKDLPNYKKISKFKIINKGFKNGNN